MTDLHTQGMFQQAHARPVSGEELATFGKYAAAEWGQGREATLSQAVVSVVKHAHLSPEQVRRVVEFANHEAFSTEFKKEGAGHKIVSFSGGPADFGVVLGELNNGSGGTVFDDGHHYSMPPRSKTAGIVADQILAATFNQPAAPDYPEHNPGYAKYEAVTKVAAAEDYLRSEVCALESALDAAEDTFFHHVKQAALNGESLGVIVEACHEQLGDEGLVKAAFAAIAPRLLRDGVFFGEAAMMESLSKTASAGYEVDPRHPLPGAYVGYCDTLQKLAEAREARNAVQVLLADVRQAPEAGFHWDTYVKQASSRGLVGHVQDLAHAASVPAAAAARAGGRLLVGDKGGELMGKGVGAVVRNAPLIAALVGANEVRRRMKYSPTGQAISGAVLQHVPGTDEYNQRNYNIATGQ